MELFKQRKHHYDKVVAILDFNLNYYQVWPPSVHVTFAMSSHNIKCLDETS